MIIAEATEAVSSNLRGSRRLEEAVERHRVNVVIALDQLGRGLIPPGSGDTRIVFSGPGIQLYMYSA